MESKKDWRIGLPVKPKSRKHKNYRDPAKIVGVLSPEANNIYPNDEMLAIQVWNNRVSLELASDWELV